MVSFIKVKELSKPARLCVKKSFPPKPNTVTGCAVLYKLLHSCMQHLRYMSQCNTLIYCTVRCKYCR